MAQQDALAHTGWRNEFDRLASTRRPTNGTYLLAPAEQVGEVSPAPVNRTSAGCWGGRVAGGIDDDVVAMNRPYLIDVVTGRNSPQTVALNGDPNVAVQRRPPIPSLGRPLHGSD